MQCRVLTAVAHGKTQDNGEDRKKDEGRTELEISDQTLYSKQYTGEFLSCQKDEGDDIDTRNIDQSIQKVGHNADRYPGRITDQKPEEQRDMQDKAHQNEIPPVQTQKLSPGDRNLSIDDFGKAPIHQRV